MPPTQLREQVTLLTGASRGVGRGVALGIAASGAREGTELGVRAGDSDPEDDRAPPAKVGLKILQIHGDEDEVVTMGGNSTEPSRRHRAPVGSIGGRRAPGSGP